MYPLGIIVRRSVPVTPARKAGFYLPGITFLAYAWYMHKEYPRTQRCDFTAPDRELN